MELLKKVGLFFSKLLSPKYIGNNDSGSVMKRNSFFDNSNNNYYFDDAIREMLQGSCPEKLREVITKVYCDEGKKQELQQVKEDLNLVSREQRELKNVVDILQTTTKLLANVQVSTINQVNPDWASSFFDYAKNCSDDKIKLIWAKILAGEMQANGTFYKRTLSVLNNMENFEADMLVEIKPFLCSETYIPENPVFTKNMYAANKMQSLIDCGLLNPVELQVTIEKGPIPLYGYDIEIEDMKKPAKFAAFLFTDAGYQLLKLIEDVVPNKEFAEAFVDTLNKRGIKAILKEHDMLSPME